MVIRTTLTPEMIDAGGRLAQMLEVHGVEADAVFWLYSPDVETWRLVVAHPGLGERGATPIYREIQDILAEMPEDEGSIVLSDVTLKKPEAEIVTLLRKAVGTGPDSHGVRFQRGAVDARYIEDAYVYRIG